MTKFSLFRIIKFRYQKQRRKKLRKKNLNRTIYHSLTLFASILINMNNKMVKPHKPEPP